MKNKLKTKTKVQKFLSSNEQYVICKYDDSNVIKLYTKNYETSLYDLAQAIYNDCIKSLNISTPLNVEAVFYRSRNMTFVFEIKNCQSIEDVLKELCKQLKL